MDWFERLTGFRETDYDDTRAKLKVDGSRLQSLINGKSYGIGEHDVGSERDEVVPCFRRGMVFQRGLRPRSVQTGRLGVVALQQQLLQLGDGGSIKSTRSPNLHSDKLQGLALRRLPCSDVAWSRNTAPAA
jgi:hypothetical protein